MTGISGLLSLAARYLPTPAQLSDVLTSATISRALLGLITPAPSRQYAAAMTSFNRPGYMREVLYTLANNAGLDDYTLHFGLEPVNPEVLATAAAVQFLPTVITVNPQPLGVTNNPYTMLQRVFTTTNVPGVLYLEDDVILAPDAVRLATWYFQHPSRNQYLCLNLYNPDSKADASPEELVSGSGFNALGIAITREQWFQYFQPGWHKNPAGWDWSISEIAKTVPCLLPKISRSHHIGREGGTWYDASRHDDIYCPNPMCTQPTEKFRITG